LCLSLGPSTLTLSPLSVPFPYTTLFRSPPRRAPWRPRPRSGRRQRCRPNGRRRIAAARELSRPGTDDLSLGRELRHPLLDVIGPDRKSTRLNSSHVSISYAVFCLKKEIR